MTDIVISFDADERSSDVLMIGFFTPNYQSLAETFAANCRDVCMDAHLYAVDAAPWEKAVLRKPEIVQRAARDYPDRTMMLIDVDCIIKNPVQFTLRGDVAFPLRVKIKRGHQDILASSRVLAFRASDAFQDFAASWRGETLRPDLAWGNEESALLRTLSFSNLCWQLMDVQHSALELHEAPKDAVIIHDSAHDKQNTSVTFWKRVKRVRRAAVSRLIGQDYMQWKYKGGEK